ncbi:MAG TPA: hypothetical protein VJU84_08530 [Pyrinomonadaceae bacterium]|nr:hypothetical protein [Pyrinomonadaceae bacterium]
MNHRDIILLALLALFVFVNAVDLFAQSPAGPAKESVSRHVGIAGGSPSPSPAVAIAPELTPEQLLKIRDLQYSQAKVVLEMRQLEARYKELQQQGATLQHELDRAVTDGAKSAGVDLDKWIFDTDKLKFVTRPNAKPETPNSKP